MAGLSGEFLRGTDDIAIWCKTLQNVRAAHVGAEGMYVMDPPLPANILAANPTTLRELFGMTDMRCR